MTESTDLVTVSECGTQFDAQLVVNYLEANGVQAYISGGVPWLAALNRGVPSGAVVQVAKSDTERAVELLKERVRPEVQKTWVDAVAAHIAWFVVAMIVIIPLVVIIGWLLGFDTGL